MATVDQAPGILDLIAVVGDDLTVTLTVTENGVAYSWTGATVITTITATSGFEQATDFTATTSAGGVVTLVLTDAQTTTLGAGVFRWSITATKAGYSRTWLAGVLKVGDRQFGSGATSAAATVTITTSPTVTVAISGGLEGGTSTLTTDGDILTRAAGVPARITRPNLAADSAFSSRYGPGVFTVDSYLLSLYGVTPAAATSAQTLAAYEAARDAAFAVSGTVKFTPGRTYQIDAVFIIKSAMTFDCQGATLKKRNGGLRTPLIVNESWSAGNPDITILAAGAVWDFNGLQTSGGGTYGGLGDCVHLQNVDRLTIKGRPFIKDATKFALLIGHAEDIEVDGARFDTRSDGCHLYGPMRRAKFGTFTGTTGDDFFAMTISDYAEQITNLTNNGETTTLGDFEDIHIDCLQIENDVLPTGGLTNGSGFSILGNSAVYKARRIYVGAILGRSKQAVRLTNDQNLLNTQIEDITFGKIACNKGSVSFQVYLAATNIDTITIGEIAGTDTAASSLVQVWGGTIGVLNINGITHVAGSTGALVNVATAAVVLGTLNISNVNAVMGSAGCLVQHVSTTTTRINVTNFDIRGSAANTGRGCTIANSSAGPKLRWSNGRFKDLLVVVIATAGASTVMIDNVETDTCYTLFEINGATVSLRALFGTVVQIGNRGIARYNSGKYSTSGPMARTDITQIDTANSVAGDLIYNTNAAGAVGLGVAQWNGTTWVLV